MVPSIGDVLGLGWVVRRKPKRAWENGQGQRFPWLNVDRQIDRAKPRSFCHGEKEHGNPWERTVKEGPPRVGPKVEGALAKTGLMGHLFNCILSPSAVCRPRPRADPGAMAAPHAPHREGFLPPPPPRPPSGPVPLPVISRGSPLLQTQCVLG